MLGQHQTFILCWYSDRSALHNQYETDYTALQSHKLLPFDFTEQYRLNVRSVDLLRRLQVKVAVWWTRQMFAGGVVSGRPVQI